MAMKKREGHSPNEMTTVYVQKTTRERINKIRGAKMKESGKVYSTDDVIMELLNKC